MIYPWQGVNIGAGGAKAGISYVKQTDQSAPDSSLVADSVLFKALVVAQKLFIEFDALVILDATGSYSFRVVIPAGAAGAFTYEWISSNPTSGITTVGATTTITAGAAGELATLKVRGHVVNGGTGGNAQFQFAAFGTGPVINKAGSKVVTWH